jgi:hypothetical protein
MPFSHNTGTLGSMGFQQSDPGYIGYVIGGRLKLIVFWLTPFFIFFAQMSIRVRWRLFRKSKKIHGLDLILIIALIIFIQYTLVISIAYYFPKYYAPFIPLTAILIAYCITRTKYFDENSSPDDNKKTFSVYLLTAIITIAMMALLLGDPNLSRNNMGQSVDILLGYIALFFPAMILMILLFKYYLNSSIPVRKAFIITVAICLGTGSLYINAVQMTADYSVRYNYGEEGMQEVIDYVRANTEADSVIIVPKDIGYYVEVRFYEAYGAWMEDWEEFNNTIQSRNITHIVIRNEDAFSYKELPDEIIENILIYFDRIEKSSFGDFVVFERK